MKPGKWAVYTGYDLHYYNGRTLKNGHLLQVREKMGWPGDFYRCHSDTLAGIDPLLHADALREISEDEVDLYKMAQ